MVNVGGLWGIIDTSGNEIVPPRFDEVRRVFSIQSDSFSDIWEVRDGETGLWGLIDASGIEIVPTMYHNLSVRDFSYGLALVSIDGKELSFINTNGDKFPIELDFDFSSINRVNEELFTVIDRDAGLWGLIRIVTD